MNGINAFIATRNHSETSNVRMKHHSVDTFGKYQIVRTVTAYSNTTKKYVLCLHEKLEIFMYPDLEELLNKRS